MCETYKFFLKKDGQQFGPYTAQEMRYMGISSDTLVTEEGMNGKWVEASKLDFDDMAKQEMDNKDVILHTSDSIQTQENDKLSEVGGKQNPPKALDDDTDFNIDDNDSDSLGKWNWGAFFFGWLWAACHGIYWPLFGLLVGAIPYVGRLAVLGMNIVLAIKGNQWAWEVKEWENIEHFKRVQRRWAIAAACVFGISLILIFIVIIAESTNR